MENPPASDLGTGIKENCESKLSQFAPDALNMESSLGQEVMERVECKKRQNEWVPDKTVLFA